MTCNLILCLDAFVTKLDASGAIVYSTFLGGSNWEQAEGIAADPAGNAYVTGTTGSCDFPTANALQPSPGVHCGSWADVFVVKVDPQGQLIYSTYLGGEGADNGGGAITADADGNVYVTGGTYTTDLPMVNPIQEPALGTAFIAKLDATGSKLLFSTYYGVYMEERQTQGVAIALDAAGNLYVSAERVGGAVSAEFVLKIDVSRIVSAQ